DRRAAPRRRRGPRDPPPPSPTLRPASAARGTGADRSAGPGGHRPGASVSPPEEGPKDRPRFPSPEWAQAFRDALNANARYREVAAAWEGDFLLVAAPGPGGGAVHVDLFRGECRSARFLPDPSGVISEYTITGRPEDWRRLLSGE